MTAACYFLRVLTTSRAKYALAVTDKVLDIFGQDVAIGYDIGCAFSSTVAKSRILAAKATRLGLRMLVPAFHGHAHNRGCQISWHPLYIACAGIEDFETCKRVFSQSNALTSGTCHAPAFHRYQAIEEYFAFWDDDKYANLSASVCGSIFRIANTISFFLQVSSFMETTNNLSPSYRTKVPSYMPTIRHII